MNEPNRELSQQVYDELHALASRYMRNERRDHTLQPTALVNEAYLRLVRCEDSIWSDGTRFRAVAASCLRRILIEHARKRRAQKRGGAFYRVSLSDELNGQSGGVDVDVLELEEVLLELHEQDATMARLIELRYFGGMSIPEASQELGIPEGTLKDQSRFALAWLRMRLDASSSG